MHPGEHIVFNTMVEPGGPKRRASRLLAMTITPKKHQQQRPRELVLTTHRLLCVKHKPGRAVQVRAELLVRPPPSGREKEKEKEKEKDLRSLVSSIEPKGEREFVVITVRARAGAAGRVGGPKDAVADAWPFRGWDVQPMKSHCYIAGSASIASTWIRKIHEAIEANPPPPHPHPHHPAPGAAANGASPSTSAASAMSTFVVHGIPIGGRLRSISRT